MFFMDKPNKIIKSLIAVIFLTPSLVFAGFSDILNMPVGVTEVSGIMYDLHMLVFYVCVVIGILVFGFMFYTMFVHRKSKGYKAAKFHDNLLVEVIWTVIPTIIVIVLAIPATTAIIKSYDAADSEVEILVVGSQWKWQYQHLGTDIKYLSQLATPAAETENIATKGQYYLQEVTEPLVLPVDTKIVFKITAKDVIHSWWVPDFGVKRDAIPGYVTESWAKVTKTGVYHGSCTELCGQGHAFMPVVVKVVTKEEYETWLAQKQQEYDKLQEMLKLTATLDEQMARGENLYNQSCASCHGVNGEGIPGIFPTLKGGISTGSIADHISIVVNGKQGTAMQAFGGDINELDLAAIITYERNAWGNNTGDVVQAADILKFNSK